MAGASGQQTAVPLQRMMGMTGAAPTGGIVPANVPKPASSPNQFGGGDINTASARSIAGAMAGTGQAMGYNPQQVQAGQLATTNLAQYQNPYTQQVIDAQAQDVLRNAQLGLNQLGTQAQRAGAFGGSRHGIAMGEIGRGVAETLGQQSAGLRQAGFQQAQQMAQQDIASRMQANLANQQAGLSGAQFRLGAANQLGQLGNLGFGIGQTINQNLMQQGAQQQAMQQQLMDLAAQRYAGYTAAPSQSLGYVSTALGASTIPQSSQVTRQPGLYDYLTMASNVAPRMMQYSDIRLKTNVEKVGDWKGVNIYRWEWNAKAKEIGADKFAEIGVIAQEVRESHPQAVTTDKNGYLVVNYDKIK